MNDLQALYLRIFKEILEIKNKIKISKFQKNVKKFKDINERSQDDNMGIGSKMVVVIVIIAVILVAAIVRRLLYLKSKDKNTGSDNPVAREALSRGLKKGNSEKYTEKDKDLMELIHELSVIYDNTDRYLNN